MARVKVSIAIDASPAEVWADIENISSHVEWMMDAVAIQFVSSRRTGVGTRFDCDTRVGPFRFTDEMEITEWKPRKSMGVSHHGLIQGTGKITLKQRKDRTTQFQWKERLKFPWYLGGPVGAFAAKPVLTRMWRRSLRTLKQRIETKSP